jgi:hypothetical protein
MPIALHNTKPIRRRPVSVTLPPSLKDTAHEVLADTGISFSEYVVRLITHDLIERGVTPSPTEVRAA